MSRKSLPSHAGHGSIICSRSLVGLTESVMLLPPPAGATYMLRPRSKSRGGTSGAVLGAANLNGLPSAPVSVSVRGLNDRRPARAKAVTISGLAMKFIVVRAPSLRAGKLRLYEVTIVLAAAVAS